MIVKIQFTLPCVGSNPNMALIYNRNQSFCVCLEIEEDVRIKLQEQMPSEWQGLKGFFYARLTSLGLLVIGNPAKWQRW